MPLARVSRQRPHTFFPDAGRKILCRWLAAVPRVLQGPSCAGRPICGPSSAAPIADTNATAGQKARFAADAAEAFDKRNCVPCAKTMAACSRVQFAPAHIPPACRTQLQTGKPFRKHGNPDICQCARRSLRSHAHRPAPPESFEKCGLAESPAPDAKAGKLDNDSGRVRNARIAHNPRKQDAVPESCFVLSKPQIPPTKRPLANVPSGSNAFFTRRAISTESAICPNVHNSVFHSRGQNKMAALNSI